MYYPPFVFLVFFLYAFMLIMLFGVLYVGALELAFKSLGLPREIILPLLLVSLIGSSINIPLLTINSKPQTRSRKVFNFLGRRFYLPQTIERNRTLLAVNLGGCIVPMGLSIYLLYNHLSLIGPAFVATVAVSFVVYQFSDTVEGVGITVPLFVPPLMAAVVSLLVTNYHAPLVAYVSGTCGTLVGADLMNLKRISQSKAPVASIGGAGTFDGIFLTGILAVLLASLSGA